MRLPLKGIIRRECKLAFLHPSQLFQPMVFMILVMTLFPIAIGPNPVLLQKVGAGVIWVTAMLSILMGLERLFKQDYDDGTLQQMMISPSPLWWLCLIKVTCHWCFTALPLVLISPIFALFFNLTWQMYWALVMSLLLGTPILSFIGAIAVALTLGLNRGGIILGLLVLPLFIPVLIFATAVIDAAALQTPYIRQLAWIGAMLMLVLACGPFTIAYGLKVSQD